ncbi:hypothetical protein [uncultured Gammaproteobacteria bacterium]|nr:hypothetical protein [uncultured Gammaproteobacteria bacterium]CAC9625549.1 hypothetical protein [uncultured Gammaproteobacteria bacterium]
MKKQLIIAAVAATMASVSQAGISITGDSYFSYANNAIGYDDTASASDKNIDSQRVRLKVVGTTGATKVTAVIRNDGVTRADRGSTLATNTKGALHMDSLYIMTKAGRFNIKAGDYWGTVGLGARSKGVAKTNAISLSAKVGPATLGVFTSSDDAHSTNVNASAKVKGVAIKATINPKRFANLSVKGAFKGITGALDLYLDRSTDGDGEEKKNNTTLIHVGGKFRSVQFDVASIRNKKAYSKDDDEYDDKNEDDNAKFAPLGSMLIGKAARGGTATAVVNVGQFTSIVGVAVSTKLLGNTVKGIYSSSKMPSGASEEKVTGIELIVTRPLGGAKLTANFGKFSGFSDANKERNASNKGLRLDVKF